MFMDVQIKSLKWSANATIYRVAAQLSKWRLSLRTWDV